MATDSKEKVKNLEQALQQIEKQFGKGAIMKFGETEVQKVEAIPTGCLTLDIALGIGGIPRGRIIEIYGPESSGKTTVALHMIAETQKQGGMAAFIDAEHALDPYYAQALGVQINDLYIAQPDSGEQALNITETLVRSNSIDLIVVDSVAALTPQAEIDGEIGDSSVGLQARLMSQAMRKLTAICNKSRCSIVFINQLREKVGVIYGSPEVTTGGKALKFYSSVRIDIRKADTIKDGAEVIGNRTKARIVKNKVAPRSKLLNLTFFSAKEFPLQAACLTSQPIWDLSKKAEAGIRTTTKKSGKAEIKRWITLTKIPTFSTKSTKKSVKKSLRTNNFVNFAAAYPVALPHNQRN